MSDIQRFIDSCRRGLATYRDDSRLDRIASGSEESPVLPDEAFEELEAIIARIDAWEVAYASDALTFAMRSPVAGTQGAKEFLLRALSAKGANENRKENRSPSPAVKEAKQNHD